MTIHTDPDEMRAEARRLMRKAAALEREAAERARRELEARKPEEPDLSEGPVTVTFNRYLSGRVYTHAAVGWRVGTRMSRWVITSSAPADNGRYTWNGLLNFIGEANWVTLAKVTEVEPLITSEDAPAAKETVGPYGTVLSTEPVEPYHGKAGSTPFTPGRY